MLTHTSSSSSTASGGGGGGGSSPLRRLFDTAKRNVQQESLALKLLALTLAVFVFARVMFLPFCAAFGNEVFHAMECVSATIASLAVLGGACVRDAYALRVSASFALGCAITLMFFVAGLMREDLTSSPCKFSDATQLVLAEKVPVVLVVCSVGAVMWRLVFTH